MGQSYSEGQRTGRLIKLSRSGCLCKTWEGEIVGDGIRTQTIINKTGNAMIDCISKQSICVPNTICFTVDTGTRSGKDIIKRLQEKLETGDSVTIKYWESYVWIPCRGDTWCYVYDVK